MCVCVCVCVNSLHCSDALKQFAVKVLMITNEAARRRGFNFRICSRLPSESPSRRRIRRYHINSHGMYSDVKMSRHRFVIFFFFFFLFFFFFFTSGSTPDSHVWDRKKKIIQILEMKNPRQSRHVQTPHSSNMAARSAAFSFKPWRTTSTYTHRSQVSNNMWYDTSSEKTWVQTVQILWCILTFELLLKLRNNQSLVRFRNQTVWLG